METTFDAGETAAEPIGGDLAVDAARAGEPPHGAADISVTEQTPDGDSKTAADADGVRDDRPSPPDQGARFGPAIPEPMLETAVERLTQVALQMEDPVQALEDGIDALAEALALREMDIRQEAEAVQAQQRRRQEADVELANAYRHARLHRVGELVDVGYSLDQAVAITNANEAEIRHRALSVGRDPDQVIHEYAVRHGYRRAPTRGARPEQRSANTTSSRAAMQPASMLERLAALPDEEFAQATRGDRWERLFRHG